jgi:hypothetical protein
MARKGDGMTRREFLRNASLATGAVTLTGAVSATALAGEKAAPKLGAQLVGK